MELQNSGKNWNLNKMLKSTTGTSGKNGTAKKWNCLKVVKTGTGQMW